MGRRVRRIRPAQFGRMLPGLTGAEIDLVLHSGATFRAVVLRADDRQLQVKTKLDGLEWPELNNRLKNYDYGEIFEVILPEWSVY